jgi:NAD(P)-dependent dehydrogenase (short-subunit alcohol dehydrogenase family)
MSFPWFGATRPQPSLEEQMSSGIPRSVVITGASSGIGAATALRLARLGWQVFAGVRRDQDGDALRNLFFASSGPDFANPGAIHPILLDVTRTNDVQHAVENVRGQLADDPLYGLVNNAGWLCMGPLEAIPIEDVRRQFEVNVFGALQTTQAFLPDLRAANGRIVHISSSSGRSALPYLGPYAASKFALEALADSMRIELHRFGVRVCLIEPGPIETPLLDKNLAWLDDLESRMTPEQRTLYDRDLALVRHVAQTSNERALPVQRVVDRVLHALTARRPKARYRIGASTSGVRFLELLPTALRDWLIRFKLGRMTP